MWIEKYLLLIHLLTGLSNLFRFMNNLCPKDWSQILVSEYKTIPIVLKIFPFIPSSMIKIQDLFSVRRQTMKHSILSSLKTRKAFNQLYFIPIGNDSLLNLFGQLYELYLKPESLTQESSGVIQK
jgi:hypothetical protein